MIKTILKPQYYLVALLFIPFLAHAQEVAKKGLLEKMMEPKFSFESAYMDRANIKDSDGSVQVTKNRVQLNNSFASFSYTNWRFGWDNIADLPFGDGVNKPIEEMHGLNLSLSKPYRINERWFTLSSISISATFEDDPKDSLSVGVFSFASYAINKNHTLQMGLFGNHHSVRSLLLPIISYSYRANYKDGIQVILGFPQTHIGYHVNRETLLRLGVVYSNSLIRLSDNSSVEPEGFNEFQDYIGSLGVTYDVSKKLKLKGDFLYAMKRDLRTYNKDAKEMDTYAIEPTAGLMLKMIFEF